jgi:hypothetical protein
MTRIFVAVWVGLLACGGSVQAGGLAILETAVSDNGDGDGFADTKETVTLRLRVQNTTNAPLTDVVAHLTATAPVRVCIVEPLLAIGDLAVGETRWTTDGFVFTVADLNRATMGLNPYQDLSAGFEVTVTAGPVSPKAYPWRLGLELDLDVSGGDGPTTFFESFESPTQPLGAFVVHNMDAGVPSSPSQALVYFPGFRCQYNNPFWPNSNTYGTPNAADCYPTATVAQSNAVFWGISGPETSPLGGRGFTGSHSLYFGIDKGPPKNWTTPLAVLEAVRSVAPIPLGWSGPSPTLSIKHQVSLIDGRVVDSGSQSVDRGVVMVQVANAAGQPAEHWIKLDPYQNVYDEQAYDHYTNCTFDPVDDGNTEDDFFDPTDPERRLGPSSTCFPEYSFAYIGETSHAPHASQVGHADGPGLVGQSGLGTWIESRFDLSRFRGQSVRLRFLATALKLWDSMEDWEQAFGFNPRPMDDGWWIDDVTVTGVLSTPATVVADGKDNSNLPGPPASIDPDLDAVCGGDNCPDVPNPDQKDVDRDGWGKVCDCADSDAMTRPGAVEVNDGKDNQCPGFAGYGAIDEISGTAGFLTPDKNQFSWPAQQGATQYQVARAANRIFSSGCFAFPVTQNTSMTDTEALPSGEVRYYLVRAFQPHKGSWGQNSAGQAIVVPCAP